MSAQRYRNLAALDRMEHGYCPECGEPPERHSNDSRFWLPRGCDLTERGVLDRIAQYDADREAS